MRCRRPCRPVWRPRRSEPERGQATVELALVLPLLFSFVLVLVQLGLLCRDQVLAVHAARQAARVAAIDGDDGAAVGAALAATGLDPQRLTVELDRSGSSVRAAVHYDSPIVVPLLRRLRPELQLEAAVTMYDERVLDRSGAT